MWTEFTFFAPKTNIFHMKTVKFFRLALMLCLIMPLTSCLQSKAQGWTNPMVLPGLESGSSFTLGKHNFGWQALSTVGHSIDISKPHHMKVEVEGDTDRCLVNRLPDQNGSFLWLYAEGGNVSFTNVSISWAQWRDSHDGKTGVIVGTPPTDAAGRHWYDTDYQLTAAGNRKWKDMTAVARGRPSAPAGSRCRAAQPQPSAAPHVRRQIHITYIT